MEKIKKYGLWAVAVLLGLSGLAQMVQGAPLGGLLYILAALIAAPPFREKLAEYKVKGAVKAVVVIALLFIAAPFTITSTETGEPLREHEQEAETSDAGDTGETPEEPVKSEDAEEPLEEPQDNSAEEPVESEPTEENIEPEEKPLVGKDINDIFVNFVDSVRNDVTGRWRLARVSDNIQMQEYAVSYYNTYFKSNDEIHFVVNFTNDTTSKVTYLLGMLEVDVYERVDGEEHDANILPGGKLLAQYWVDMETGEIEDIGV